MDFQDFVGELVENCVAGYSCARPWPVERQVGEMPGPRTRGLDSAVFQESKSVDLVRSGEEWHRVGMGDQVDSSDH